MHHLITNKKYYVSRAIMVKQIFHRIFTQYVCKQAFLHKKLAVETNIFEKRNILRSNQIIFTLIVATEIYFLFLCRLFIKLHDMS